MGNSILDAIMYKFGSYRAGGGGECIVECHECGREKLYINQYSGLYNCFYCGIGGNHAEKTILKGIPIENVNRKPRKERAWVAEVNPCYNLDDCIDIGRCSLEDCPGLYLLRRFRADKGHETDMIKELDAFWNVQYCRIGRKFADGLFDTTNTLLFPIDNFEGKMVAWQARLLYDPDEIEEDMVPEMGWKWEAEKGKFRKPPKYFTAPGWSKDSTLYNISTARKGDLIILTEGVFDVFAAGRSAVCAFGKALSETQRCLLKAWSKCIVLLLDPDAAENQADIADRLRDSSHVVVPVTLHGFKDAGEAGRAETLRQVRAALEAQGVDPADFRWFDEAPGEGLKEGREEP